MTIDGPETVPLPLRLSLRLERAWDLLDPESDPESGDLPDRVFADLAGARKHVEHALAVLKGPVDSMSEADRAAIGETLSEQNRGRSDTGEGYDL